jgi:hypothetical protein
MSFYNYHMERVALIAHDNLKVDHLVVINKLVQESLKAELMLSSFFGIPRPLIATM